jgi:hypothetical protein
MSGCLSCEIGNMKEAQTLYGAMRRSLRQLVTSVVRPRKNRRGPVILRVCSWCQSFMGVKDAGGLRETMLSHGMCDRCAAAFRREVHLYRRKQGSGGSPASPLRF